MDRSILSRAAVAAVIILVTVGSIQGAIIISDDFDVPGTWDQRVVTGVGPNLANLPGGTWQEAHGWDWAEPRTRGSGFGGVPNAAQLQDDTGLAVSIMDAGSYIKPSQFSISADIAITAGDAGVGAVALGFYTAAPPPADRAGGAGITERTNFTGLLVDDGGSLQLIESGLLVGLAIDGPDLDRNTLYRLIYDVDTSTGSISNVSLDGNPFTFTTSAFSGSATAYAAFLASGGQNTDGAVDNFTVSSIEADVIPEPASLSLLALGGLSLLARRRRRR